MVWKLLASTEQTPPWASLVMLSNACCIFYVRAAAHAPPPAAPSRVRVSSLETDDDKPGTFEADGSHDVWRGRVRSTRGVRSAAVV